jgi:RNA polymerase sigma-70 factor (ECF subfamily)
MTAAAYYALGNKEDAQDAVQEALVYAFQHLGELRATSRLLPWLRSITINRSIDLRRRKATRPMAQMPERSPHEASAQDDPARLFLERTVLEEALQQLPPPARTTFLLFHQDGHSLIEVAEILNIPVNTVRSRLQAARRALHCTLSGQYPERIQNNTMPVIERQKDTATRPLPENYIQLIQSVFPDATIRDWQWEPEMWMPFEVRVRLTLPNGFERSVDFRGFSNILNEFKGSGEDTVTLLNALKQCGLPVPERLSGLIPREDGHQVALCSTPIGENLLLWAFDGNPHRIRRATDMGIAAIDQLHAITKRLLAEPIAKQLPRRTLVTELDELIMKGGPWLNQPDFASALQRLRPIVAEIAEKTPLCYTNDTYGPNFLRFQEDHITEFVLPFGWFGDPLLGFAKLWTYDCYPFVHTGFVERYLFEHGFTRKEFAPRLAIRALWTLQRETPAEQGEGENSYRDDLMRLLRYALESL